MRPQTAIKDTILSQVSSNLDNQAVETVEHISYQATINA